MPKRAKGTIAWFITSPKNPPRLLFLPLRLPAD
jgi:hypothetical protein